MPRHVDHTRRREEIASALWRVVQRDGMRAVSVRSVAKEGGWSVGSLRHYFRTSDELLQFAMQSMSERVSERVRAVWWSTIDDPDVVESSARVLEEGLPLDETRAAEVQVWFAFLDTLRTDPALKETMRDEWVGARYLTRLVVCRLAGLPVPRGPHEAVSEEVEAEAVLLHAFWDGLTLHSSTFPEQYDAERMRRSLRQYLTALRHRLREGASE